MIERGLTAEARRVVEWNNHWRTGTLVAYWTGRRGFSDPVHLGRTDGAAVLFEGKAPAVPIAHDGVRCVIPLTHVEPLAEPALHIDSSHLSAGPQSGDVAFPRQPGQPLLDEGSSCLCSRCGQPILDVAVRLFLLGHCEWRYHVECLGLCFAPVELRRHA